MCFTNADSFVGGHGRRASSVAGVCCELLGVGDFVASDDIVPSAPPVCTRRSTRSRHGTAKSVRWQWPEASLPRGYRARDHPTLTAAERCAIGVLTRLARLLAPRRRARPPL